MVERDEASRKYRLGLGLIAVAGPLLANLDVRRIAMEDLQTLREITEETGIVAEGLMDAPGWVKTTIDLDRIAESRRNGRVLPFAHWPESEDVPVQSA